MIKEFSRQRKRKSEQQVWNRLECVEDHVVDGLVSFVGHLAKLQKQDTCRTETGFIWLQIKSEIQWKDSENGHVVRRRRRTLSLCRACSNEVAMRKQRHATPAALATSMYLTIKSNAAGANNCKRNKKLLIWRLMQKREGITFFSSPYRGWYCRWRHLFL